MFKPNRTTATPIAHWMLLIVRKNICSLKENLKTHKPTISIGNSKSLHFVVFSEIQ